MHTALLYDQAGTDAIAAAFVKLRENVDELVAFARRQSG